RRSLDQARTPAGNAENEPRVVREVASPQAARLAVEAIEPLESTLPHPARGLAQSPGMNIERCAHPKEDRRIQAINVVGHPAFLLGRAEPDPHQIGGRSVDALDRLNVFRLRWRSEWRRFGPD